MTERVGGMIPDIASDLTLDFSRPTPLSQTRLARACTAGQASDLLSGEKRLDRADPLSGNLLGGAGCALQCAFSWRDLC